MRDFEYAAPTTLGQLTALLHKHGNEARLLAGGTDLIEQIRTERAAPELVIDVKRVPEMNELGIKNDELIIGAAVNCRRIYEHTIIPDRYAALADSARIIGGIQIQNRATLGGNLCNASPAADSIPAMMALRGQAIIREGGSNREIPIDEFCLAPGMSVLKNSSGGMLVGMRFPVPPPRSGSHYRRFIPRNEMDIAVVGVGAFVQLCEQGREIADIRLALGAVGPTPILVETDALIGRELDEAIVHAAGLARAAAQPVDDMRGTRDFRLRVTAILVDRVLRESVSRARDAAAA